ncbi:Uncharacterised protein [Mycobacteroides abscessus subsp. bolletii]|nr:Uncharacterised protein [Mycobacteroides abscessus subsp. bolletii]
MLHGVRYGCATATPGHHPGSSAPWPLQSWTTYPRLGQSIELIPTDDLNDGPTIIKAGPQAVVAWSEALVARDRFHYAVEGFNALRRGAVVEGDRVHTLLADGAAAARIVTSRANRREDLSDAWHVARCGFRPVLTTISGYLEHLG